jgi:hypothetical protein
MVVAPLGVGAPRVPAAHRFPQAIATAVSGEGLGGSGCASAPPCPCRSAFWLRIIKYIIKPIESGQASTNKNDTTELIPIPRVPASGASRASPRIGQAQQAAILRICFSDCMVLGWLAVPLVPSVARAAATS